LDLDHTPWVAGAGPNEVSKLCLSCHDGTVAVNSLVASPDPTMGSDSVLSAAGLIITTANLNSNLSNDHPISFDYSAAIAGGDAELKALATVKASSSLEFFGASENIMECSTCHDPHEYGATAAYQPFLTESKAASNLCLECHIK
jgi:predicted CXXCH cytochrome family protein